MCGTGEESAALAREVLLAMEQPGVRLQLAHEMPGLGGQAERRVTDGALPRRAPVPVLPMSSH